MAATTPRRIAEDYDVKVDVVLAWIHSGELRAYDVSEKPTGRPRWRILDEDLQAFLRGRQNHKPATAPTRYRRRKPKQIKQYF